ncbi:hypothetical protein KAR91_58560 [Candidatus Pacearchaeota archaeon]|nr:hypothetical protein [Candidatus Pacearchaeota archaeon]
MNFVKLTTLDESETTFINFDKVCEMRPTKGGNGTTIYFDFSTMEDIEITKVRETTNQILEKL